MLAADYFESIDDEKIPWRRNVIHTGEVRCITHPQDVAELAIAADKALVALYAAFVDGHRDTAIARAEELLTLSEGIRATLRGRNDRAS